MTFTLLLVSGESQDFACEIKIDGESTFYQLHRAIAKALKYNEQEFASFFLCDDNYERTAEISIDEMFSGGQFEVLLMHETKLKDVLTKKSQKFQYQFDLLTQRCFFINVLDMDNTTLAKPKCMKLDGQIPVQSSNDSIEEEELLDEDMFDMDLDDDFSEEDDLLDNQESEDEEQERQNKKKMTASDRAKAKKKRLAEMSADDYLGSFEDRLSESDLSRGIYGFDDGDLSLDEGFHDMYDEY